VSYAEKNKLHPEFWKNKKVFLTGHTGFMGSWLAIWLTHLKAEVHGVSLDPITEPNLYSAAKIKLLGKDHRTDIRSLSAVQKIVNELQPEIIFHLAAQPLVLPSYNNPVETFETNVMGTVHVLEAARNCPSVRSVAVVTSDKCYDNKGLKKSFVEEDPLGGDDPYSASKGATEVVVSSYRKSFFAKKEIPLLSFRAGNIIGGGDWSEARLVPDLIRSLTGGSQTSRVILRNPSAVRPWQHVIEPVYVYMSLVEKSYNAAFNSSESWNIGPEESSEKSVLDVAEAIARHWGKSDFYEAATPKMTDQHEAPYLRINSQKLKEVLGWKQVLNFEQTIQWTAEWYKGFSTHPLSASELCLQQIQTYWAKAEQKL